MFTKTEKGYLILTLGFLAAGSGIKAYRHAAVRLGPFEEAVPPMADASSPSAEMHSPAAETVSPDSQAMDSTLSGPAPGLFSQAGPASQGEVLGRADPVRGTSKGYEAPDADTPAAVNASKASESNRAAGSGAEKAGFTGKIDLNKADAAELTRVNGIGAKTAQAIVDYRRAHGPYRNLRDLLHIKGIGEKKLEKLMPNLIL